MGISISRKILWAIFVAIILGTLAPEVAAREPKPPPKISQNIKDSLDAAGTRIKEFFAPLGTLGVGGYAASISDKITKRGIGVGSACIGIIIVMICFYHLKQIPQEKEGEVRVKTDSSGIDISARGTPYYIFAASGFVLIVGGIIIAILSP